MKEPNMKSSKIPRLVFMLKNTAKKSTTLKNNGSFPIMWQLTTACIWKLASSMEKYILKVKFFIALLLSSVSKVTDYIIHILVDQLVITWVRKVTVHLGYRT